VRHLRWSLRDEQAGAHRCVAQRPAPVEGLGVGRQATLERGVRGRLDTDLTEDPASSTLLVGSMIRASTRSRNTLSPLVTNSNPNTQ
jgi:hypothetical protein